MEGEQLFSATPYLIPVRKKQDNSKLLHLSPVRVHLHLLINNTGGTEKMHNLYKNWVVFYYHHKVIINHSYPERNLMKFFIVFL